MNDQDRQHSSEAHSLEGGGKDHNKRKSDDGSSTQIRAKRNRYISIAWCGNLEASSHVVTELILAAMNARDERLSVMAKCLANGAVTYPWSACMRPTVVPAASKTLSESFALSNPSCCNASIREFRMMNANIQSLQDQVDRLYSDLNALGTTQEGNGLLHHGHGSYPHQPSLARPNSQASYQNGVSPSQSRGKHPRFQGPTTSAFNFDVAHSSLQTMGITDGDVPDEGDLNYEERPLSSSPQHRASSTPIVTLPSPKDPIWKVGKEEAIRLCRVYEEAVGITYPMFDFENFVDKAEVFLRLGESAARGGLMNRKVANLESLDADDINIFKIVLATALTDEGNGQSELGQMLFDSVRRTSESKLWEPAELKGLILLVVVVRVLQG